MKETKIKNKKIIAIVFAILAAVFYALNTPFSKLLLEHIPATFMASFLYLGAGIGIGIISLFNKDKDKSQRLTKSDLPYTIGMIVLDIAAPILLMLGISNGTASNAALLNNFEIVATAIFAFFIFKEKVSPKLWVAIAFITISSAFLSIDGIESFKISIGSIYVLLAACCWGLENNCTRKISSKNTFEIVTLKGLFSGLGSFIIALILKEQFPEIQYILLAMLLGFVAYGLSIFMYVRAQRDLGAAKTSAYYAIAPFLGTLLAFIIDHEIPNITYFIALALMIVGSIITVYDTLNTHHIHEHTHVITHTHDGYTHTHVITHKHEHDHFISEETHSHKHTDFIDSPEHKALHAKANQ